MTQVFFDEKLFSIIESHKLNICAVLLTSITNYAIKGIQTIEKIYNVELYHGASNVELNFCKSNSQLLEGDCTFSLLGTQVNAISFDFYQKGAVVYKIENNIFSGNCFEAGFIGKLNGPYKKSFLVNNLKEKIFSLSDDHFVLPKYGPVTTLKIEKKFNAHFRSS